MSKNATPGRLLKGIDWHAWAWKYGIDDNERDTFFPLTEHVRPSMSDFCPTPHGLWVKVKFIEVPWPHTVKT